MKTCGKEPMNYSSSEKKKKKKQKDWGKNKNKKNKEKPVKGHHPRFRVSTPIFRELVSFRVFAIVFGSLGVRLRGSSFSQQPGVF